jgi:hypothetical protein
MLPEYRGQADAQSGDPAQGDPAVPLDHRLPQDQGFAETHQPGLHVRTSQRPLAERHHTLFLCGEDAPSRVITAAGAGCFSRIRLVESEGITLAGAALTPETLAERFEEISSREREVLITQAWEQTRRFVDRAQNVLRHSEGRDARAGTGSA